MNPLIRTGMLAGALAGGMTGLGYASVPLYRAFCEATGFAGTTQRADEDSAPGAVRSGKIISVRFDANHVPTLPWTFSPEKSREAVTIGEREIAFFAAKNLSNKPITGRASFNVTPTQAGRYFTKIECFCFTEQTLKPGQQVRMPVIFFVDPKIIDDPDADDISEITLSYTFYPVDESSKPS
jgi:cytochrome c oxidase assembly protein subunit 11